MGNYIVSTEDIAGTSMPSDEGIVVKEIKEKLELKRYRVLLYRLNHHG